MVAQTRRWILTVAAFVSLAACASAAPTSSAAVTEIVSTTSFGMCQGYCSTRLEISSAQVVLTREPSGRGPRTLPTQRLTAPVTASEWEALSQLAARTDLSLLPPVIGCPDCADGGAESLTIVRGGETHSVSFDYGATVDAARPLIERVRALRTRLTPPE